jgi:hypothetical protein
MAAHATRGVADSHVVPQRRGAGQMSTGSSRAAESITSGTMTSPTADRTSQMNAALHVFRLVVCRGRSTTSL